MRLIPGYSLGKFGGIHAFIGERGASLPNIYEIARQFVKVGHAAREMATVYSVTSCY